jgi:hypothetical protein
VKRWLLPAGIGVVCLIAGYGVGQSNADPIEVEKLVEVERLVERTPPACIEALDISGEGFEIGAEAMGYSADAMQAIANFDIVGIEEATVNLDGTTNRMNALQDDLGAASSACRAAA